MEKNGVTNTTHLENDKNPTNLSPGSEIIHDDSAFSRAVDDKEDLNKEGVKAGTEENTHDMEIAVAIKGKLATESETPNIITSDIDEDVPGNNSPNNTVSSKLPPGPKIAHDKSDFARVSDDEEDLNKEGVKAGTEENRRSMKIAAGIKGKLATEYDDSSPNFARKYINKSISSQLPPGPEIVREDSSYAGVDSAFARLEDVEEDDLNKEGQKAGAKKNPHVTKAGTTIKGKLATEYDNSSPNIVTSDIDKDEPDNDLAKNTNNYENNIDDKNIGPSVTPISPARNFDDSLQPFMVEAYVVDDSDDGIQDPPEVNTSPVSISNNNMQHAHASFVKAHVIPDEENLCSPKSICMEKNGKIKKKCLVITIAVIAILATIGIIVGIFVSKSTSDSNGEIKREPANKISPSPTTSLTKPPSSVEPPAFNCSHLCLTGIKDTTCPNDPSLLGSCHLSAETNVCVDDKNCVTAFKPSKCNTEYQIYRRVACHNITDRWERAPNGFEYYIETLPMTWEEHQKRAVQFNASLSSFHDQYELDFVDSMLSNSVINKAFIGGKTKGITNTSNQLNNDTPNHVDGTMWEWVDDTMWDFTDWNIGLVEQQTTNETYNLVLLMGDLEIDFIMPMWMHQGVYKRKFIGEYSIEMSLGGWHSCATNSKYELYCWGDNEFGQVGAGSSAEEIYKTVKINVGTGRKITKISLGDDHTCVLLDNNDLKCWGDNYHGQVGDNSTEDKNSPTKINIGGESNITQLALGAMHTCVVLDDGTMKCWGSNYYGQLGDNSNFDKLMPTVIDSFEKKIMQVALGDSHTCVILIDKTVQCWGKNWYGQLGDGNFTDKNFPTAVIFPDGQRLVKQIAIGDDHTCAVLDDGFSLWCWGKNLHGQLGDGTLTDKSFPTKIFADEKRKVKQIALGWKHSCLLLDDDTLKCWGGNDYGQLGDGTFINRTYPTVINVGVGRTVTQIAVGGEHTCALFDDSSLRCWGDNDFGGLGLGDEIEVVSNASESHYVVY